MVKNNSCVKIKKKNVIVLKFYFIIKKKYVFNARNKLRIIKKKLMQYYSSTGFLLNN